MKRLFVSDLDGTLLNKSAKLSERTVELLNKAIGQGMSFTVSTARTPATALKILEGLELRLPVMLMNGVVVYDPVKECYLKKSVMDEMVIMVLLGMIKLRGLSCFLYGLEKNEFFAYYDSMDSTSLNYFRNECVMRYDKRFTEVEDLSLVAGSQILYCMLREPKERLEVLYRELSVVKGVKAEFYRDVNSEEYYMLEIYSDQASKKEALLFVRQWGGYDFVTGFGDNLNDIPLMEASDSFFAVSNAHPDIQNMADGVILSNEEDGVARFIEQLMQNGDVE